jgi:hypothetical protein
MATPSASPPTSRAASARKASAPVKKSSDLIPHGRALSRSPCSPAASTGRGSGPM